MSYIIDSNIWNYYFDKSLPEHKKVVTYLNPLILNHELVSTTIIVIEVTHYLIKRLGPIKGYEKAKIFQMGNFEILDFTFHDLPAHLEKLREISHLGLGGRDATILVCMDREKIDTIATHDKNFQFLSDIKVIDPVTV